MRLNCRLHPLLIREDQLFNFKGVLGSAMASQFDKPPPYTVTPGPPPPAYGNNPLPPGYQPYPGPHQPLPGQYVPAYGATTITVQPTPDIIIVGGCPACRVGMLEEDYTCLGIFCAIFFFPLGILCCLALKTRRCSHCGAYFG